MMTSINAFDRVLKVLAREYAESFLRLILPDTPLRLVGTLENVELALPEERVDFVHRVSWEGEEFLFHIEFQKEHRPDFPQRAFVYSALLTKQLGLPVITVVVYISRRVSPLPSDYRVQVKDLVLNRFEYQVVKLWEYYDEIASGRWPELAPLLVELASKPDETVLAREKELILREEDRQKRADLLACAVTIGARYFDKEFLWQFFREEVEIMREATFITDWLDEKLTEGFQKGIQKGIQKGFQQGLQSGTLESLSRVLETRFGPLPPMVLARLASLSAEQLASLFSPALTLPDIESFEEVVDKMLPEFQPA